MVDNRYKDADGTFTNPECGNSFGFSCVSGEVRRFPHPHSDAADIMCQACAKHYGYAWNRGTRYKTADGYLA